MTILSWPEYINWHWYNAFVKPATWWLNSLRSSDKIWHRWTWSALVQVMVCWLTGPSHRLNQYLLISNIQWHYSEGIIIRKSEDTKKENKIENCIFKTAFRSPRSQWVNPLWPSDAIWQHRSGSTLAQVMARCLTAPSHYLNQCWLIISKVLWHSSEGNFIRDTSVIIH